MKTKYCFTAKVASFLLISEVKAILDFINKEKLSIRPYNEEYDDTKKLVDFLSSKTSFVDIRLLGGTAKILISNKNKIVIKIGGVMICGPDRVPTKAISTAFVYYKNRHGKTIPIRIQPLVDRRKKSIRTAYKKLVLLDGEQSGNDLHEGNVGMFRNKPVVIDW